MKTMFLSGLVIVACLSLMGVSHAADTEQEKRFPDGQVEGQDLSKDKFYLEIEERYITQLRSINSDLLGKHTLLTGNFFATSAAYVRLNNAMASGVSGYFSGTLQDLWTQRAKAEAEIAELEKKKENLKSEMRSHYHGAVYEALAEKWDEEEQQYTEHIDELYRELQGSLTTFNSPEEERQAWERFLQRYRLREKR